MARFANLREFVLPLCDVRGRFVLRLYAGSFLRVGRVCCRVRFATWCGGLIGEVGSHTRTLHIGRRNYFSR